MIDLKRIKRNPDEVYKNFKNQGYDFDAKDFLAQEEDRKNLQTEIQALQQQRNTRSKEIGRLRASGQDIQGLLDNMSALGETLKWAQERFGRLQDTLKSWQQSMPNLHHSSVPFGVDENENPEVRRWGTPRAFGFAVKDHTEVAGKGMDFETAARLSGSRFTVLSGPIARLHRALAQFMVDLHVDQHGYREFYVPYLVRPQCLFGTGQLPKFAEDQFLIGNGDDYRLIPTAEVPLTNLARESILADRDVPCRYVAHTPSFRREAGSYGKDVKGMIRQHQFDKVELVQLVPASDSYNALEEMVKHAETVLQKLKLPYRVVILCTGDLGFSAAKTYDLEVWLPSQQCYREISSCSNCEDFQARRLQARWRNPETGKPELLHTLNGSGVAVGRALVAVLENYQDEKGGVEVPEVLRGYMGGMEYIPHSA